MSAKNWHLGLPLTLGTVLMFATLPLMLKGVLDDIPPATAAFFRFFFAAILLAITLHFRGKANTLLKLKQPRRLLQVVMVGMLLSCNYLFFCWGLDHITPSAAQVMIQLAPILLLFGGVFFFGEQLSMRQWLGCLVFISGILLFFHHRINALIHNPGDYGFGLLCIVISACCWAAYGLLQKRVLRHIDAQQLNLAVFIIGALTLLPIANPVNAQLSPSQWLLMFLCGANTLISYMCFTAALTHWQATHVSATLSLVPLVTLPFISLTLHIWPDTFTPETLDKLSISGALLVVLGSLTVVVSRR